MKNSTIKALLESAKKSLILNIVSFLILVISGKLSLGLSSLDGYSTPVWPPAGIALALVLIFGNQIGFGIFLGSFMINSKELNLDTNLVLFFTSQSQNIIIAFGSCFQAMVSSFLVRRFAFYPHLFYSPKEIFYFFFYAGPVSCLSASTIGALTLLIYGVIQVEFLINTFLVWWMGDSIGVMIFTPLILFIWNGILKKERLSRVILVSSGMIVTLFSAGLIFTVTRNWEANSLESRIRNDGDTISRTIELNLTQSIRNTKLLGNYIQLTKDLDRNKFEAFSQTIITESEGLLAISWNPLVLDSQRNFAEKELTREYPDHLWISEQQSNGNFIKATNDREYVYVKYIYPYKENENAIGFNVFSNSERKSSIQESIQSASPQLTKKILLVQDKENSYGVILFNPIFEKNKVLGFSTAIIRIRDVLKKAVQSNEQKLLCIKIEDESSEANEKLLYESECTKMNANLSQRMKYGKSIVIGKKIWKIGITPSDEYIQVYLNKSSSFVLVISGILTGILGMLILIITGRENSIRSKVEERTMELEKANRIKTDFLANMSHEIRTPMNGVLGMLQLLEDTPLNSDQRQFTENAKLSTESLLSIINDILDVSKMEKNKLELKLLPFNFYKLVNGIIEIFYITVYGKGILLSLDYCIEDSELYILADENRLRQILINIIGNAIKFTSEGRVEVKVSLLESKSDKNLQDIQFEISDTGIGISEVQIHRLFNQFAQVEDFKTKKFEGSGLGLYISKQLVDLMGGSIHLKSEIEKGTTFFIKIPFIKAEPIKESMKENIQEIQKEEISFRKLYILVAEDNAINQVFIKKIIENRGHRVNLAGNGKEVITALEDKENNYDLILMDIQMPEMDGLTACKLIRTSSAAYKDIPIIALTANSMDFQIKEYLEVGMNESLAKPIDAKSIFAKIAKILNINLNSIYQKKE